MNKELHDYDLRYSPLEKRVFALVRVVAYFKHYMLNNPVKAYVPNPPIKMMLKEPLREGRWTN